MNIVVDGIDRCGKSTQIKLLQKHLIDKPTHVIHYSAIPGISPEQSKEYSEILYRDMFDLMHDAYYKGRNLIFDRSHIGEFVYAPIYRNYSGSYVFEIEQEYELNPFFQHIVLIVLIDEPQNAINREDGNSFSTDVTIKSLEIDKFKQAYELSFIKNKLLINIAGKSIDDVHNSILSLLENINSGN